MAQISSFANTNDPTCKSLGSPFD